MQSCSSTTSSGREARESSDQLNIHYVLAELYMCTSLQDHTHARFLQQERAAVPQERAAVQQQRGVTALLYSPKDTLLWGRRFTRSLTSTQAPYDSVDGPENATPDFNIL
eukprot:scaffold8030_cov229-Pinguiococcus_pyrenoidosus.AAC.1